MITQIRDFVPDIVLGIICTLLSIAFLFGVISVFYGFRLVFHIAMNYPNKLLQVIFNPKGFKALKNEIGDKDKIFNRLENKTFKYVKRFRNVILSIALSSLLFFGTGLILDRFLR